MNSSATDQQLALAPARRPATLGRWAARLAPHLILLVCTALAILPIVLVVLNSFKERSAIFATPYALPLPGSFSLIGYTTLLNQADFSRYFANSLFVTLLSMTLILLTGAMASFALAEYRFRGNTVLGLYLALGIMIPIRLGTVSILYLIVGLGLTNTLWALVLVYTAQGLPLTIFILSQFMRQVPFELKDAARIDGASEYRVFWLILPLVRPALATVAVFIMIPIWNDLWFPLILAPSERTWTVTLGAQQFLGQFISDWNAVLSALTLAIVPVLLLYIICSRQLIRGLTAGTTK
jgi:raffinose/stachyose/melibiose transport system permease protein